MNSGHCSGEHAVEDEEEEEGRLSLNELPDELLIQIFNRLLDLKFLILCSLVSPRFSSLVFQVHSVRFPVSDDLIPTPANPATDSLANKTLRLFFCKPFEYFRQFLTPKQPDPLLPSLILAFNFLYKFKSIRSLHLLLPSSPHRRQNPNPNPNYDDSLYKWAAKLGPTIDTFFFLSTSSIRVAEEIDFDDQQQEEDPWWLNELAKRRAHLAMDCLQDAIILHRVLRIFIRENPLLHNITITDSNNHGSLSLRDSKLVEIRNWLNSSSLSEVKRIEVPVNVHLLHVPVLKLPTSRKVMMSVTLVLIEMVDRPHELRDSGVKAATAASLFSEQGEDEFAEAVVEMMVNHYTKFTKLF